VCMFVVVEAAGAALLLFKLFSFPFPPVCFFLCPLRGGGGGDRGEWFELYQMLTLFAALFVYASFKNRIRRRIMILQK